jgi:hypothetical protein
MSPGTRETTVPGPFGKPGQFKDSHIELRHGADCPLTYREQVSEPPRHRALHIADPGRWADGADHCRERKQIIRFCVRGAVRRNGGGLKVAAQARTGQHETKQA